MTIQRTQVLWVGKPPTKTFQDEFKRRELVLNRDAGTLSDAAFLVSCAIVFSFDETKKGESIGLIKAYTERAAEHGLLVVIRADKDLEIVPGTGIGIMRALQFHLPVFPVDGREFPRFSKPAVLPAINKPAYALAEACARHAPGYPLKPSLEIKGELPSADDQFLLRRAFSDCQTITIEPLKKGLSGARVYAVYAEFPEDEAAPYPLPYFAKIDTCKRIVQEFRAYDRFVTRHVPFSQRPNCEPDRCLLGLREGILVGDFVDNSQSLAELVQPNGGRAVIHSLFDDALRGWRQQAYKRSERMPFSEIRDAIVRPERIKRTYVDWAIVEGVKAVEPRDVVRLLDDNATHSYRRGPVHGDLNAQNIRVRNGEAILIDFYKSTVGPLVCDLASLEIAICFSIEADIEWNEEKDGEYRESERFKEWRRHIDALFSFARREFEFVPPLQEQPCGHAWMWNACRQLRLMAHYIEPEENAYACVISAYMMRLAMYPDDEEDIKPGAPDTIVRSYAYRCAERLLRAMNAGKEMA